jgi:hypothetical protein
MGHAGSTLPGRDQSDGTVRTSYSIEQESQATSKIESPSLSHCGFVKRSPARLRMPSPTSRQSCVTNSRTENIRSRPNLLSGKQFWKSAWALRNTLHGPAKGKSAKLNSHYGINSGGIVCFNKVAVMKEWSFLNANYIPALTAIRIPGLYHRRMGKTRIYERLHVSWYCFRSGPVRNDHPGSENRGRVVRN